MLLLIFKKLVFNLEKSGLMLEEKKMAAYRIKRPFLIEFERLYLLTRQTVFDLFQSLLVSKPGANTRQDVAAESSPE